MGLPGNDHASGRRATFEMVTESFVLNHVSSPPANRSGTSFIVQRNERPMNGQLLSGSTNGAQSGRRCELATAPKKKKAVANVEPLAPQSRHVGRAKHEETSRSVTLKRDRSVKSQ
jgi:hypothetical protein